MTIYQTMIRETLARIGRIGAADPRHIEAWMREEHATLDALDNRQWEHEVNACATMARSEPELSERLALACGL